MAAVQPSSEIPMSPAGPGTDAEAQEKPEEPKAPPAAKKKSRPRAAVFLALKAVAAGALLWDTYSAWEIFHHFASGAAGLPDESTRRSVSAAWGVFAAVGVLLAGLVLWDELVEALEDFGVAGRLKGRRVEPHHELWIVATAEELPQSTVLLIVLLHYSVTGPKAPAPAFLEEALYEVFLDSASVLARLIAGANKLLKVIRRVRKEPAALDVAVLVVGITEVLLLAALAIAYTVIKNQRGL